MSVEIVTISDKRLALANGQWAATLNIGTSWNTIRIGWRWSLQDSGASFPANVVGYMGVLSSPTAGLAEGPLNNTCTHYVGSYGISTAPRTAGAIVYYATAYRICKKVGAVVTQGIPGVTTAYTSAEPGNVVTCHVTEIIKGSPNFTVNHLFVRGTAALVNVPETWPLQDSLMAPTMTATAMNNYIGGAGTRYSVDGANVAVNEAADGYLNAVTLAWGQATNIYYSDLMVVIFK